MIVLDTNIVLDAFVFNDPATESLKQGLDSGVLQWVSTQAMRDELERVLAYPKIAARLARNALTASAVLARFDSQAHGVEAAPKAPFTCRDADDQKFIDLAVTHKAILLSKDDAVLCMRKRLLALDVDVKRAIHLVA